MIDLRCGNCIEILKDFQKNSIDCIFTDPPYRLTSGGRKNTLLSNDKGTNPFTTSGECFDDKAPKFDKWISLLFDIMKDNGYLFIMSNDRNLREIWEMTEKYGFKFCELLVMSKNTSVPSLYFFKSCEFILMFRKNKYKVFNKYGQKSVFDVVMPRGKNKFHPTEKPIKMIQKILESVTNENDTVLDLFMGCGSTGIACVNTNRNFIGIEINEKYFKTAEKRIKEAQNETNSDK